MVKILVVDDEPENRDFLKMILERAGYRVVLAVDGQDGFEKLTEENPDIAILDVNMPRMNGFELCGKIRGSPDHKTIPILILSVRSEERNQIKGYELGADDYLPKPFNTNVLISRIQTLERRILKKT
jgi:DNA-binding response OmpR family regulator